MPPRGPSWGPGGAYLSGSPPMTPSATEMGPDYPVRKVPERPPTSREREGLRSNVPKSPLLSLCGGQSECYGPPLDSQNPVRRDRPRRMRCLHGTHRHSGRILRFWQGPNRSGTQTGTTRKCLQPQLTVACDSPIWTKLALACRHPFFAKSLGEEELEHATPRSETATNDAINMSLRFMRGKHRPSR